MAVDFLIWLNILTCFITGLVLAFKKNFSVATLFLAFSLFLVSVLNFLDFEILRNPQYLLSWGKYVVFFEALFVVSCYFYTKTSFRDNSLIYKGYGFWIAVTTAVLLLSYACFVPVQRLIFSPDFADEKVLFLTNQGFVFYLILMIFLVFGLAQLERTLAALHQLQRWKVKLEIIGSGLLMAAFTLYFSHSLLYRSINMNYLLSRSIVILLAVGLVVYSRFFRDSGSKLALSRGIAFRSFVLLIIGAYFILLGVIGEGLRYLNISNVEIFFYVLLLLSGLALAGIFLSETLQRKLRVLLRKNFYQSKYDYRDQWENFAKLSANSISLTEIQVSVLDLFCTTFACKGGAFYLLDQESDVFINTADFNFRRDWRPFPLDDPLIDKLQKKEWIINLSGKNPDLPEPLISFLTALGCFLVVPLYFNEKLAGFLFLGEQINRGEELTFEDYDMLRMLARQAIATVQGQRLTEQLSTSRELAAIGKVSTFVLHDLKNQVSGLSLMLDNVHDYIDDPAFQLDMLETVTSTVSAMKDLISRLKNLKKKPLLVVASVDLSKIVEEAIAACGVRVETKGEITKIEADKEEIYKVVLNLVVNAIEATGGGEGVKVEYGFRNGFAYVDVSDSGCGMSREFIETKLFKPFQTTKKNGFGIGLYQCRQIVESHGGGILVDSIKEHGTRFTVTLPLAPDGI